MEGEYEDEFGDEDVREIQMDMDALDTLLPVGITRQDIEGVEELMLSSRASSTRDLYDVCVNRYLRFVKERGRPDEVEPDLVAVFINELFRNDYSRAYIANHYKALRYHFPHLKENEHLKETMIGVRRSTSASKQVSGVTAADFAVLMNWQRTQPGEPGSTDLVMPALIAFMRDGMLRPSECIAARWEHLDTMDDGSAALFIPYSKTDQEGEGAAVRISRSTMGIMREAFGWSFNAPASNRTIWEIGHTSTLRRHLHDYLTRILGTQRRFSGYSPRVGMAQDLVANNISHDAVMVAGRWKDPRMPTLYSRNQALSRGAIAQFYAMRGES